MGVGVFSIYPFLPQTMETFEFRDIAAGIVSDYDIPGSQMNTHIKNKFRTFKGKEGVGEGRGGVVLLCAIPIYSSKIKILIFYLNK